MEMATLLTTFGTVFTAIISYFGEVIELFVTQPILLLTFMVGFTSVVVHMARGFLGR